MRAVKRVLRKLGAFFLVWAIIETFVVPPFGILGVDTSAAQTAGTQGSIANPNLAGTVTGTYTLGGTPSIGPGGSALTNGIVIYSASLTPTQTSAAIQTVEQTFNPAGFTGLSTSDKVYLNGPAPTSLCPPVHVRVSSSNTLAIAFSVLTAANCTPASGTYNVIAIR